MIPLFQTAILPGISVQVASQIDQGWLGPARVTEEFENSFAEWVGTKHAIATTSGTTALMLSLLALDLPAGSTILAPAYGMCAGANVARLLGFNVKLVDVDKLTGTIEPAALGDLSHVAAAIFIDHNGQFGARDCIAEILHASGVVLIEDACQAMGIAGAGVRGSLGCFSLSPQKLLTTGQGGLVVTSDDDVARRLRQIIDHGGDWRQRRIFFRPGGNFRFNDVLARLGAEQLRRRHELLGARLAVRNLYSRHLPAVVPHDGWLVAFPSRDAYGLVEWLKGHQIESAQLYPPVGWGPLYAGQGPFPGAEEFHARHVYLPSWGGLTESQIGEICDRVVTFEEHGP